MGKDNCLLAAVSRCAQRLPLQATGQTSFAFQRPAAVAFRSL